MGIKLNNACINSGNRKNLIGHLLLHLGILMLSLMWARDRDQKGLQFGRCTHVGRKKGRMRIVGLVRDVALGSE